MLPSRCLLQPICMFLLVGLLRYLPAPKLKSCLATESPLLSRNLAYLAQCSCSDSLLLVISSKFLQLVVAAVAEKRGGGSSGFERSRRGSLHRQRLWARSGSSREKYAMGTAHFLCCRFVNWGCSWCSKISMSILVVGVW